MHRLQRPFVERYKLNDGVKTVLHANEHLGRVYDLRIEDFTHSPIETTRSMCEFLGVQCEDKWLAHVTHKVKASPHVHWKDFCWPAQWVKEFDEWLRQDPFLAPYAGTIPANYQHDIVDADDENGPPGMDEDADVFGDSEDDSDDDAHDEFSFGKDSDEDGGDGGDSDSDSDSGSDSGGDDDGDRARRRLGGVSIPLSS